MEIFLKFLFLYKRLIFVFLFLFLLESEKYTRPKFTKNTLNHNAYSHLFYSI